MAAPFLGRGGEFPCRIDPPCIESVVPSDAVDASADEEQRDGEQRQNREDERQPRALRQRVEVKVEMLALTTGPCADAAEVFFHAFGFFRVACVRDILPPSAPIRLQKKAIRIIYDTSKGVRTVPAGAFGVPFGRAEAIPAGSRRNARMKRLRPCRYGREATGTAERNCDSVEK